MDWYIKDRKPDKTSNYSQNYNLVKSINRLDQRINVLLNELRKVLGESS